LFVFVKVKKSDFGGILLAVPGGQEDRRLHFKKAKKYMYFYNNLEINVSDFSSFIFFFSPAIVWLL
jgi:hypothetical protein